jgi:serine protease AprX
MNAVSSNALNKRLGHLPDTQNLLFFVTLYNMEPAKLICPLCHDKVDKLVYSYHLNGERQVLERIKQNNPGWSESDGTCSRCVDYYHTEIVIQQRILPEIGPHFPVKSADDFIILPTGLRLNADQKFTGKSVTICFIDSGFYPHPDLVSQRNRIKAAIDITNPISFSEKRFFDPSTITGNDAWHGTMTSVVCAGDGYLSQGLYKGIASDAELVLLKVQDGNGSISEDNIVNALLWVLKNHKQYNIRIVNMSIGSDEIISYHQSRIDLLAEELIANGIIIVAAVGNDEQGMIKPPANSPNVITVGGIDDENKLAGPFNLYHSTFGKTTDDIQKPELTAPAIWIAAPILPGTKEYHESGMLNDQLQLSGQDPAVRDNIISRLKTAKYISNHYMHVDGTSFAAPMVSAVLAQMLEADPGLSPATARKILFSTAKRIEGLPAERQGFGTIQPNKALLAVLRHNPSMQTSQSPVVNNGKNVIEFSIHHECATQITLAGSFNNWSEEVLQLEPGRYGTWKISIPLLPAGRYHYKFRVDQSYWLEDVNNPYREPDGFNGFNSVLLIKQPIL